MKKLIFVLLLTGCATQRIEALEKQDEIFKKNNDEIIKYLNCFVDDKCLKDLKKQIKEKKK